MKLLLLSLLLTTSTFAATTGTLILKGTVPQLLDILVTPEPFATTLPLSTTQADSLVAEVRERSNSATGYTVSVSSANLGKLVHETVLTSTVNYSLKYNGQTVNLLTGSTFSELTRGVKNRDVEISYTGVPEIDLTEGEYTDTVTFTIVAI